MENTPSEDRSVRGGLFIRQDKDYNLLMTKIQVFKNLVAIKIRNAGNSKLFQNLLRCITVWKAGT